jgi:hypothetical protein
MSGTAGIAGTVPKNELARPPPPDVVKLAVAVATADDAAKSPPSPSPLPLPLHDMECLFCLENVYEEPDHIIDIDLDTDADMRRHHHRPPSVRIVGHCHTTADTTADTTTTTTTTTTTDTDTDTDTDDDHAHAYAYAYAFETESDSDGEPNPSPKAAGQLAAPPPTDHRLQNCGGLFSCECAVYTHPPCLQTWLLHNQSCPMCKTPLACAATTPAVPDTRRFRLLTPAQRRFERNTTAIAVTCVALVCGVYLMLLFT